MSRPASDSAKGRGSSSSTNFLADSNFSDGCRGNMNLPRPAEVTLALEIPSSASNLPNRVASHDRANAKTERG